MASSDQHGASERKLVNEIIECLTSSLDVQNVMDGVFPVLAKLLSSDQAALCVSNATAPGGYDWSMVDFPLDWFSDYAQLEPHDFIKSSVMAQPNKVLIDTEMCSRRDIEANLMYRRALEVGMPVQQAMAVMLDYKTSWHAGITFYRSRRRPFSEGNRKSFQRIVPVFANALRNCKLFAEVQGRTALLDELLRLDRRETILMASPTVELERSPGASSLIARWFAPEELGRGALPLVIANALEGEIRCHGRLSVSPEIPARRRPSGVELQICVVPVPRKANHTAWAVVMREVHLVPECWHRILTPREVEVASRVALGWDNRLIADDLRCSVLTVKKHVQHILDKLGTDRRGILQRRAAEGR
ncbi:helix-turn-helix transcriptional regulator [Polyangium mundeleinium]|uniref:Helix-turn-helix transcriptional regulator n=1 Tax=Polyangium mundeleinium TaxID=2995306 RepID=A0ABT5EPX2_9BACT|nr:helix-turn-helix transcriptional regulator [Polyangium mundeleinium]MDC0743223.1 helix-turn-helix transcriptional regulator [Polyangium mundeleinium]